MGSGTVCRAGRNRSTGLPQHLRALRLGSLLLAFGFLLALWAAPNASAGTVFLRPDATASEGTWATKPDAAQIHAVLFETIFQPTIVTANSARAFTQADGPAPAEVHLDTAVLRAGENVTSTRAWGLVTPGSARGIDWALFSGATSLASTSVAAGGPDQWTDALRNGTLTQAQIDDLRLRFTATGTGVTTDATVWSAYVELNTDMAPPAPTITGAPLSPGRLTSPSWSFTGTYNSGFECRLTDGARVVSDWGTCTSAKSYSLTGEPNSTYTFSVRSVDSGGLTSPVTTSTYVYDTVAPAAPTIVASPTSPGNNANPSWSFTGEAGATMSCRLMKGATTVSNWANCTSPRSYNISAQTDGTFTFEVRATDAAGNTGTAATSTYVLDRAAPAAPTITSGPSGDTNLASPSWGFTAEAGSTISCRIERGATVVDDWSTCTSPKTYSLSGQPDGTYTFRVRATDAAANTGAEATRTITLDRSAPVAPTITGGPSGPTKSPTPNWTFTTEAGSTTQCRLERGATVISAWGPCTSSFTRDLTAEVDGTYVFRVKATDAATNEGPEATRTITLDRSAPAAPSITGGPTGDSQNGSPTYTWTSEAGASLQCRLERGGVAFEDWTACVSGRSYNLGLAPDGTYTFRVKATDAALNEGAEATRTYTLDRSAPAAPSITGGPTGDSQNASPSYSFTQDVTASRTECRLERGATVVEDWTTCTSAKGYGPLGTDGTYTFRAKSFDAASNESPESTRTYTLDTTDPVTPSVTSGPNGPTKDDTPTWAFTSETGAGVTTECRIDRAGVEVIAWAACTSPYTENLAAAVDGSFELRLRTTDAAGNVSAEGTRAFSLDRQSPAAPALTTQPANDSQDDTPTWEWTAEGGGTTTECQLERGVTVVRAWSACTSPETPNLTAGADGAYTFRVRATDPASNVGAETVDTYTLDRADPAAPVLTATPAAFSGDDTPTWSYTAETGAAVSCQVERGATVVRAWAPCAATAHTQDLTAEPDGTYTFRVKATDAALNESAETTHSYTLDQSAPAAPSVTGGPSGPTNGSSPMFAFTAEAGSTQQCRLERGATVVEDWTACASGKTYALGLEPDGAYTFRVKATDAALNEGAEATRSFDLDRSAPAAPWISDQPTDPSSDQSPTWQFTAEVGATTECRIMRGATQVYGWAACSTPHTVDLSGEVDGTYTLAVRAVDPANNTGPESTSTYTLDRDAPLAPTIDSAPATDSSDATPTWAFSAEAGATTSCRVERGALVISGWASCTSPYTETLTSAADGTYTFRVKAFDGASNEGAEATHTYTLDRSAPVAPTITGTPAANSSDATPTWTYTAEAGAGMECRVERGATVVSDWAACATGSHTPTLTGEVDGTYTFRVRAVDAAQNTGADSSSSYTLDRSAPSAPTFTGGPSGPTNGSNPSWTFTAEAGAATACRIERGATVVDDWAPCVSPRAYDLSLQPDGTYTVRVRATDAALNTGADATRTIELDRSAPAAPTITSGPDAPSQNSNPSYGFTAETGAATACRIERGATVVSDWAPCTSPQTYALGAQPDGTYTFRVRATDPAGNTGAESTRSYDLDRSAPAEPAVTSGPSGPTNNASPSWAFTSETAAGSFSECRIERGATLVADWTVCTTPYTANLTAEVDGSYTLRLRTTDAAANVSTVLTRSFELDRSAPAAPTITGGPPANSSDAGPSYTFTQEAGASASCRMERSATVVQDWGPCASPKSYDLSAEIDGTYTFRVRATDPAGNTGAVASRTYELDRVAPNAPTLTAEPAANTNNPSISYSFTSATATTFNCRLERGATVVRAYGPCTSPFAYDLSAEPDGIYTFRVRASDLAANESTETTDTFALDRSAPAAPSVTSGPTGSSQVANPSYGFSAEAGSATQCQIERGATVVDAWAPCVSPRSYDLSLQPDGTYTFRVRATDAAGNTSADGTRTYTLDRTAPVAPTVTSGPATNSNDDTPLWAFTGEAGATFDCRVMRGATVIYNWAPCATSVGYDLSGQTDGTYTFRVRATDAASNVSPDGTHTYTLDRNPPAAPSITAGPSGPTNAPNPSWSFTAEAGTSTSCRVERGATVVSNWAPCVSPRAYDLSAQPDGTYTFRVRATDAANNTGSDATRSIDLDRSAPAAPSMTGWPTGASSDPQPAVTFTHEAGATATCRIERGATVVQDWTPCASPTTYDFSSEPDGFYTFRVRATDPAGNVGAATSGTYELDRVAPPSPTLTSKPAAATNNSTATYAFTSTDANNFRCRLERSGVTVSDWSSCASPRSYDLSAQPDAVYTFRVRSVDAANNQSTETTDSFALDRSAPAAPVVSSGPNGPTNGSNPSFGFSAEAGSATQCRIERGATVVDDWAPCVSPRSYDLSLQPDAAYTFRVRATDAAGNTGADGTRSFTLDRLQPPAPTVTGGPNGPSQDDAPSWSFTAEVGATTECRVVRGATTVVNWAPCTSPQNFNLTAQVDGVYTFEVRATDPANNTGPAGARTYTLDRTAPVAPTITTTPAADSNDATPTWSWSAEAGAVAECRVDRGATVVVAWTACTTPYTPDLTAEVDGTYTFSVRVTDAAGNTAASASGSFRLDRAAPVAPTLTGGPDGPSNNQAPAWSFTAEAGAATACRVERGATVIDDWGPCVSPRTYDLSMQVDGAYTFRVRATDAAGNTGADGARTYTLDRVAPVAPTVTTGPSGPSQDGTPTWGFTAEPGATTECRVVRGATEIVAWAACTSPQTFDIAAQADGVYTFEVRATDPAGNTGAEGTRTYTLDRTNPAAPTFTSTPAADSSDATPTWGFSAEAGATFECRVDRGATVVVAWTACTTPYTPDLSGEVDGTYTLRVRATDTAGNTGADAPSSFRLDRAAPVAPTLTGGPDGPSNNQAPAWSFTAEAGAATTCRVERGATVIDDWGPCVSPRTYDLSMQVDGAYTFRVRATDAAGNTGADGARTYTLDRVAPVAPTVTGGPNGPSQDGTPTWDFTAETGATTECRVVRGATEIVAWTACTSPHTFDIAAQADGVYTFEVRATDPAGNTGVAGTRSYTLDRTAPATPAYTSAPAADSSDDTPTWAYTAEAGATTSCRVERGATVVADWAACASPHTHDLTSQVDGTYTIRVRATDPAGNTGPDSSSTYRLDRAAPNAPDVVSGPTGPSQDDAPSFGFTAEAGSATACRLERGATVVNDWAPCVAPRSYDLTLQPDGVYTFRVRATDAALNTGADGTRTYTLDRTDPAAPSITGGPNGPSQDDTPAWSYVAEPGSTTECRVMRGATEVIAWAACTSPQGFDLQAEPDGSYTVEVEATDAAGNRGVAATRTYTLDRDNPDAPTIDDGPAADSSDATPTFTFTGEAGSPTQCRVERGATVVTNWAACASPHTPNLTAQADGTFTFRVRSIDPAGNVGDEAARSYTLDRNAPSAPTFTGGPSDPSKDTTPTWTWTAEAGATAECQVQRGPTVISAWASCSSAHTHDLGGQPDGTYDLHVRVTDAANNTGAPASRGFRLDTTEPVAPTIDSAPGTPTADGTPEWTFSGEAGARFECSLTRGATTVHGFAACASPKVYDLDGGDPDGNYTFQVRAIDEADNTGDATTSTIDVDRTQPTGVTIDGGPGADGNDKTPTWSFSGDGTGGFRCRLMSGTTEIVAESACTSPRTFDLSLRPDATYTLEIQSISTSGTRGPVLTDDYRLDTVEPAAPSIDSGPPSLTFDATPEWAFSAEPGARFECRIDRGTTAVQTWAACSTPQGFDLTNEVDGTYTVSVKAIDPAGNESDPATASYTLDRVPPPTPTFTSEPPSRSSGRAPQWGFTGTGAARFECRVEYGGAVVTAWATCTTPERIDLDGKADGVYTFSVRAISSAGVPSDPATDTYDLDSGAPDAPTLTATPGPLGNGSRPSWAFTAETGAALACRLERDGGIVVVDWAACSSPKDFDLLGEPDGLYLFSVRATDDAGNTGATTTHAHRVDRVPPEPPTVQSAPPPVTSTRAPIWTFRAEAGAGIECRLEGPAGVVNDWGACTSPKTFDLTGQPDGAYTLLLRATDPAGNRGIETRSTFTLDATAPGLRIDSGPGPLGRERNIAWAFSGDKDAGFECRLVREAAEVVGWAPCASPNQYDLTGKPDGLYRFWLRARDAAGNPGQQVDSAYELDTTPPREPEITDRPESPGDDRTPTWRFTGEDEATFDCRVERGTTAVLDWAPCRSPFTADLERAEDGEYRFNVRATDRAGNRGAGTMSRYTMQRKQEPAPTPTPREEPEDEDEDDEAGAGTTRRAPAARPAVKKLRKPEGKLSKTPVVTSRRKERPDRAPVRPLETAKPKADDRNPVSRALGAAVDAAKRAAGVVADHPDKSVFPGALLLLVLGFLAVQGRLDRGDPKLALAPDFADPDLEFRPPPGNEP